MTEIKKMEKKKFKFSNEIMNDLVTRAKALPPVARANPDGTPVTEFVQVPGTRLKKEDLAPGQVLNPNLIYRVKQIVFVDHYKTMVELFRKNGPTAVDDYEQATLALKHYSAKKLHRPWYIRLRDWFLLFTAR